MDVSVGTILAYSISLIVLFIWIRWRNLKLKVFENLGIPGPYPHFLFGNIIELNKKGHMRCHADWIAKYGKIVGFYHGMKPVLLVADPDLLKKIFIKDFHLFCNRPEGVPLRISTFLDAIIPSSDIMDNLLINLKGEHWKNVRSILSPTFSANKLKGMFPAVNQVCDSALSILDEKSLKGEVFDIHNLLERLTLDIISAQAFGMDIDSVNDPHHPLLKSAKIILELPFAAKIVLFGRCFPELGFLAMAINFLTMFFQNKGVIPPLKITKALDVIIKQRRSNHNLKKPDLLQWLIDSSEIDSSEIDSANKADENGDKPSKSSILGRKKHVLTDTEIKANSLVVLLAGLDSTSASLAFSFYFMAKYPEFQKKIQEEIDLLIEKEGQLDYNNIANLQQMERLFMESLRFYSPAANAVSRVSVTDVDFGDIYIPKGMEIHVPVEYIHRSDEFWERPEEFDPDRFLPGSSAKLDSCSYMAFGVGPRSCIGQRMVNITAKIILAKILHKFTVELAEPQEQVKCFVKVLTMSPHEVLVKLKPRLQNKLNVPETIS